MARDKWEKVDADEGQMMAPSVKRLPVPGGWLYHVSDANGAFSVVFVPRAKR